MMKKSNRVAVAFLFHHLMSVKFALRASEIRYRV